MTHPLIETTYVSCMRQDYTRCWTAVLRPLFYCKHQGALTQYPWVTLTLASLKDIITQIKTLLLLNKLITSERDSLDCSIFRPLEAIRSWAVHVFKTASFLPVHVRKRRVLYGLENIFLAWQKTPYYLCLALYKLSPCEYDVTMMSWQQSL